MRVLIISSHLPYPPSWGAATRVYQLARHLARRHQVTLLCYAKPDEDEAVRQLRREIDELRTVPRQPPRGAVRRLRQLRTILSAQPFAVQEDYDPAMQRELDVLLQDRQFDVVQVESVRMSRLRLPADLPMVLDEHNVESELLQRLSGGERSVARRAFCALEYRKLRRVERRAWRRVAGCAVTSEREEGLVGAIAPTTPTLTVPNGVDTDYFAPAPGNPTAETLLFIGALNYRPNVDAVHHLVQDVMPLVWRERPTCTLTIVGKGAETVRDLQRPGVSFAGVVPDVRPWMEQAAVVVVPLRMGGGTRLKVVEAMSMGKAVVSTTLGSEGIAVRNDEHLLLADTPERFARDVLALLNAPSEARRLGAAAAELARCRYSWAHAVERLEELHARVVEESSVVC